MLKSTLKRLFGARTRNLVQFDYLRFRARLKSGRKRNIVPAADKLHLGCGKRRVQGWLNVDVVGSEFDVDVASGRLPWKGDVFSVVLSQHVIEHLDLKSELLPLLRELHRVMRSEGEIWLSCPDMRKVLRSYAEQNMEDMLADRQRRYPNYHLDGLPNSQMVNDLFYQGGEHKNLFDFALLEWTLQQAGFNNVREVNEAALLNRFPEFPPRHDDIQSLYVCATRP